MREKKPELASFVLIGLVLTSIFAGAVNGAGVGGAEEEIDYPIVSNLKAQSADNPLTITLTPVADATVKSWQPDTNFGSEDILELSYSAIDEVREVVTLLRFDVASAMPEGAIIDSATLELFLVDGAGADAVGVAAYFVTSNWAESRVTWNSFPTAEPIGIISQVDRSLGSYKSWQVTSFAREWQSGSNNGIYLRGPVDGTYYERTFESREHMERVPQLAVTYHLPSPTYTFTGNVYQGSPPDTNTPAGGVTVELCGDEDEWPEAGSERVRLSTTTTDDAGAFSLSWEPGDAFYPYLHVIELDPPGAYSTGAQAEEPGYVKNFNVVSYLDIPPGTYDGIAFWDQPPEEKPDLNITDVWNEEGRICYQIQNIGEAVAPGGHCTALSVDDAHQVEDCVDEDLAPGAGLTRCFEYGWECTPPEDVIRVCADHRGDIEEREEENNCLERIFECAPEEKPDLIITDIWNENSTICYQIRNIGDTVATEGHYTALFVDGNYRVSDLIDADLELGERWRGCFDYDWACTPLDDNVVVRADYEDNVAESDETNNFREESWKCDTTAPEIISGPTVQEVTQDSAVIFWETNEDSDSVVKYGKTARMYALEETDPALVREHSTTLSGLEPSTTYNFVVQSTDASGNTVESKDKTFETLPLPDDEDPTVSISDPGVCQGTVTIYAEASDNTGVEKVEFFIGDMLVFTDFLEEQSYRLPRLPLDTYCYDNGKYTLKAKAYDLSGRAFIDEHVIEIVNFIDVTAPTVDIFNPPDGATVSGEYPVHVHVEDDSGWSEVEWFVDGKKFGGGKYPTSPALDISFWWDTRSLEDDRRYTLAVKATDETKKTGLDTVNVYVSNVEPPYKPDLIIEKHEVTRHKNTFSIELTVKNQGKAKASKIEIHDLSKAFQPISRSNFNFADYEAEYISATIEGDCVITDSRDLAPDDHRTYAYAAIPVLVHPKPPKPSIGHSVKLSYEGPGKAKHENKTKFAVFTTTKNVPLAKAYDKAIKEANYLIVTNPGYLVFDNPFQGDEVNGLLSDMAQLAFDKQGVLGYLEGYKGYSAQGFKDLIEKGGKWSSKLKSDWTSNGYLLIVGETGTIPAWSGKNFGTVKLANKKIFKLETDCTDYPYASTYGSEIKPELSIGRIIGNDAKALRKPIQTSINVSKGLPGYEFNRTSYFAVSGYPKCLGGKCGDINFKNEVFNVALTLKNKGAHGVVMFTPDYTQYNPTTGGVDQAATKKVITNNFFANTPDRDVIFLAAHGNAGSWDEIDTTDVIAQTNPFGSTSPFVFASSCLTGRYSSAVSLAEAFLNKGAAVYLGATQSGLCCVNGKCSHSSISKKFFEKWDTGESIGLAVKQTKQSLGGGKIDDWWSAIYHVYGDPKFGREGPSTNSASCLASLSEAKAPSSIEITIPDYNVTSINSTDYVEIPEGYVLFIPDMPLVPYYRVFYDYPSGYQIQDVVLTNRSEPVAATGLNIPNAAMAIPGCCGVLDQFEQTAIPEWWPLKTFEWDVFESPNSTTLAITIYPFYYNNLTTDVMFYKNYSFDINYTISSIEISKLETDKHVYAQGEQVIVDFELENVGLEGRAVVVNAVIKEEGSDEVVSGLFLRTLKDFVGKASYSTGWNSSGFESGYYSIDVELKDAKGTLLDRKIESFRLGISSGVITNFTATPEYFEIGDEIEINRIFNNTGTVNITGTAIIKIVNSTGGIVKEFRHNVTDLMPSESISFRDVWDTSGAEEGSYNIIGYVLYDSKATEPVTVTIYSGVIPCVTPTDDLYINSDITLCPGVYNIPDSGADGVIIINASNIVLDGNGAILNGTGSGFGIYNPGFDNVEIKNCTILNYDRGIFLQTSNYNTILGSNLSFNDEYGIELFRSTGSTIARNVISSNDYHGILLFVADAGIITENLITANSYGVYVFDISDNNEITGNEIVGNLDTGIYMSDCDPWGWCTAGNSNNYIGENLIRDNSNYGIFSQASDSTIDRNIVCGNGVYDLVSDNWLTSSGDNNICNKPDGWNDDGTTGCTYPCSIEKPDLMITEIKCDRENDRIGYEMKNIGEAVASAGYYTTVVYCLDDYWYSYHDFVDVDLNPEESYQGWFPVLPCDIELSVCADTSDFFEYDNLIEESDEGNNCREMICECCVTPTDDLYINSDTTLCPGVYNIADSGEPGVIIINADNVVLDCNGATLKGDNSGCGILNIGFDNVTIKNGNVLNYGIGIHLSESDNSIISNINVSQSSNQGISIDSSHYCDVYGNRVSFSGDRGITFGGGGNNAVYDNTVYNNSAYGAIEAIYSDNNEIYNNTAYFNSWGIATNHGSNNLIYENTIFRNQLGVYLDWPSTDNSVFNNNISSNRKGIWTNHNSTDNIIAGNTIFSNEYAGIRIETDNNTITNNTANNNRIGLYLCANLTGNTVTGNSFCNNLMYDVQNEDSNSGDENTCDLTDNWNDAGTTGCTYPCVKYVTPKDDLYINSDTTLRPGVYNIPDSGAEGVIIINASNVVLDCNGAIINGTMTGSDYGIYSRDYDNVTIKNCNVMNYLTGIELEMSSDSTITHNNLSFNRYGIYLFYSDDSMVTNNNANSNKYKGIGLASSSNNLVTNNNANANGDGIFLGSFSPNNKIAGNNASSNKQAGIYIYGDSSSNKFSNNRMNNNLYGIYLGSCICPTCSHYCPGGNFNNTIKVNEILNNEIGIFSNQSNSMIDLNIVCDNIESDFNSSNWLSSSGDNNTCDKPNGWNDAGTTGCTYTCPIEKQDLKISDLKGPDWSNYVGKEVTVEGIFVRDPLPMLVTDLDIVRVNMPMPDDQYILLIGNDAEEIDPRSSGGAKLRLKGLVAEIDDTSKYGDEYVAIESISYEMLERLEEYAPEIIYIETYHELQQPHRYAILFSGGIKPADNHIRYWNDLKFMYSTLVNEYGYTDKTIAVLYADGKAPVDLKTGQIDKQMPVHYSATQTNLQTVFNLLRKSATKEDFIFMFTTNHGGGFYKAGYKYLGKTYYDLGGQLDTNGDEPAADVLWEADYKMDLNGDGDKTDQVSWDEELCSWGGSIFDDTFHTLFANLKYDRMVIVMEQCFSGGLIADMAQGGSNRIIMSAAGEYEPSYAMEPYPYNTYNEFSYYFTCAINGADPKGKTVNADANGDGEVSMVEAFNYARAKDTQLETPWYEDSGDGVPHSGKMPAGGDGTLGSNTSLD